MGHFVGILIFRTLIRGIGQYSRYIFFRLIGKKRSLQSLSNESKDDYKDLDKALTQDFLNAAIGAAIFCMVALIIAAIVFQ